MADQQQLIRRQKALGDFGAFALQSENLDEVLTEACRLVGESLGTARAKVLEIQDNETELLVRAGVGWDKDVVGKVRIPMSERSSETFSIREGKPIVSQNIAEDTRFVIPEFMKKAGVVALVNVPIFLPGRRAYGLLQVDAAEPRAFGVEDVEFLNTYSTILGPVIDRLHKVQNLRTVEERFRLIVETARDYAIFTTDARDHIDGWFSGAEAVFGWTASEAIGQPSSIVFTPEDRALEENRKEIETARREGSAPNVRWHQHKDGRKVYIEGTVRALLDDRGEVRGFVKIGQDVTKRRADDERLRDSEAHFRALVNASSDVVYRMGPDWTEMRRLDGRGFLTDTEAPTSNWVDEYILPEDRDEVLNAIKIVIRTKSPFELEHRVRRIDGSVGWTFSRAIPIFDDEGEIVEWFGMAADVTARKQTESALRESEERFRQFGDASQDILWIRDAETLQWLYLTPAFEAIYGLARDEALTSDNLKNWLDLVAPEDRDHVLEHIERVRAGEHLSFEYRIRRPADGAIRWMRDTDFPMRNPAGRVTSIGGIGRDITEEKETAEHMQVLVAELQHRTRNLMGVVRSTADMTVRSSSDLRDFSARFRDRLDALARVQGLLSRLNDHDRIYFDELIRSEISAMNGNPDKITLTGPSGVRLRSSTVQTLAMALHELATNAIKYGAFSQPEGRLSVTWALSTPAADGQPWLQIDWRESGVEMKQPASIPQGNGQGRELIEQALPYQLNAKTSYRLRPDGVHCLIDIPVSISTTTGEQRG